MQILTYKPLHPDVFPSIPQFEAEVVAMTAAMLGSKTKSSGGQVFGNITPGGTESILMAVKSTLRLPVASVLLRCEIPDLLSLWAAT
jgi:glutamate/tyrosine decarboxylase-like PLP-dependent enzyme